MGYYLCVYVLPVAFLSYILMVYSDSRSGVEREREQRRKKVAEEEREEESPRKDTFSVGVGVPWWW